MKIIVFVVKPYPF